MGDLVPKRELDSGLSKFISCVIADAQLRINNDGLMPFSFHDKRSFKDLCQLLVQAGWKTKTNFSVEEFLTSGHRLAERNIEEFETIFEAKKPEIQIAAKRKCLNFQVDLQDKHSVSILGLSGTYQKNHFDQDRWEYQDVVLGIHGFDELITEPNFNEEVQNHTGENIKKAITVLLGPGEQGVLKDLEKYKSFNGCRATFTRDNGRNIGKALGEQGHIGSAHAIQTTCKWAEKKSRVPGSAIDRAFLAVEQIAAKATKTTLNRSLELAGLKRIPTVGQTRWDTKRQQVKAVCEAYDHIATMDVVEDITAFSETSKDDLLNLLKELDYVSSKRKLFEKVAPVGHLVQPTYWKLKTRIKDAKKAVGKQWNRAMASVIDMKAGKGTGKRTCFGEIIDDIHLVQSFLNPLYKDLAKIGVSRKKADRNSLFGR